MPDDAKANQLCQCVQKRLQRLKRLVIDKRAKTKIQYKEEAEEEPP